MTPNPKELAQTLLALHAKKDNVSIRTCHSFAIRHAPDICRALMDLARWNEQAEKDQAESDKQLCQLQDALGCPCEMENAQERAMERLRDLIAAEGELGDARRALVEAEEKNEKLCEALAHRDQAEHSRKVNADLLDRALRERDEARQWALERDATIQRMNGTLEQAEFDNDIFRQIMKAFDGRFGCGHSGNGSEDCWAHVQHLDEVLTERDTALTKLAEVEKRLIFHNHKCEAGHNEGLIGMPQGDCDCHICGSFYRERDQLRSALAAMTEERHKLRNDGPRCEVCNWTNTGCLKVQGQWMCHGCIDRAVAALAAAKADGERLDWLEKEKPNLF